MVIHPGRFKKATRSRTATSIGRVSIRHEPADAVYQTLDRAYLHINNKKVVVTLDTQRATVDHLHRALQDYHGLLGGVPLVCVRAMKMRNETQRRKWKQTDGEVVKQALSAL